MVRNLATVVIMGGDFGEGCIMHHDHYYKYIGNEMNVWVGKWKVEVEDGDFSLYSMGQMAIPN